tara:strand:+ start:1039 stop:2604 length:1566 start_codon:yes stop_codon:yes gene_type:complete
MSWVLITANVERLVHVCAALTWPDAPATPSSTANKMGATRNLVISAVSNLSTAYNLVVINIAHVMIEYPYCGGDNCASEVTQASTSCLVGAIVGQLTFGYVGDCLGRPRALQLTMAMSILGALSSAFAVPIDPSNPASIFVFLTITRFFLGVGVGGVYPLSATIASESSKASDRGRNASIVFSMQGVANLVVPLLAWLLLLACGVPDTGSEKSANNGLAWRLLLGIGAVPGILLIPFKTGSNARVGNEDKLQLNTSTTESSEPPLDLEVRMLDNVVADVEATPTTLLQALKTRKYWGKLLGTAGGWFLFDITFYGNSLFQSTVLKQVFHASKGAPTVGAPAPVLMGGLSTNLCPQMAIIAAIGLPGYYISVYFMDKLGRRNIQLQGFFFMAVVFAALGIFEKPLESAPVAMLILYGLTFFFSNFGPNSTTFILPAETFPVHIRSTLNGFSAACGKLGATIGSSAFKSLVVATSLEATMLACAGVSVAGLVLTFFFIEDKRGAGMEGEGDDDDEAERRRRQP